MSNKAFKISQRPPLGKICFALPPAKSGEVIGLFGGSFNPPHEGHILVASLALQYLNLQQLWWMVTPGNPFKDNSALPPVSERLEKSALLFPHPKVIFTGFEAAIGSSQSYDSLSYVLRHYSDVKFIWIMGSDNLVNFHLWYRFDEIVAQFPLAVIARPTALNAHKDSVFARSYGALRIGQEQAGRLAFHPPPVWCYIKGPLSFQSSRQIRDLTNQL